MVAKVLTDERLAELGRLASRQVTIAAESWELAMKCFRLNSREYRALCAAGKAADRNYHYLWLLAEARGWTNQQLDEVFTVHGSYSWN